MPTIYIHPALTDIAGQCRIYEHPDDIENARTSYQIDPAQWREIGIMDSRGNIRCCEPGPGAMLLADCVPLAAGLQLRYI